MGASESQKTNDRKYHVLFYGEVAEGCSREKVKQNLMKMFQVPEQLIEKAYSGTPLLVKDGVDFQTAQQYKTIFEKAGTVCRIEEAKPSQKSSADAPPPQPERQEITRSQNGAIQLAKPEEWEVNDCEGETQIQLVNPPADLCITTFSERKTDFQDGLTYTEFAQKACESLLEKDSSYQKVSGPGGVFINRMKGVRYEISGKPGKKRLKTFLVTLDGEQYFHLFLATALENVYTTKKPIFEEILLTFREHAEQEE